MEKILQIHRFVLEIRLFDLITKRAMDFLATIFSHATLLSRVSFDILRSWIMFRNVHRIRARTFHSDAAHLS